MRRKAPIAALFAGALLALTACSTPAATPSPSPSASETAPASKLTGTLTVFAAASLNKSFEEIAADFKKANPGVEIVTSYDGSNGLVDQLVGGAKADVLATADEKSMTRANDEKLLASASELFATNVLTLVTPPDNPGNVTGLDASLDGKRLVICAPEVPCGAATIKLAESLNVTLSPVSEESKVTDVLGKVTSGEADAGLVYTTDAKGAGDKVEVIEVPNADDIINDYRAVVLKDAKNSEGAQKFLDLILSDSGQNTLKDFGFGAPVVK